MFHFYTPFYFYITFLSLNFSYMCSNKTDSISYYLNNNNRLKITIHNRLLFVSHYMTAGNVEKSNQNLQLTYFIRMPIDLRNACVNASVFPISSENISLPAIAVKGVSVPRDWAIPFKIKKILIRNASYIGIEIISDQV